MSSILDQIETCNPVLGCTYNCPYCYARRLNTRFHFTPDFSVPTIMPNALKKIHTRFPKTLFCTSMSDLADWPEDWRETVFQEMSKYPRNTYIFLTKRPQFIDIDVRNMPWMWMGCTVTNRSDVRRIQQMKQHMKASNYHVTFEPLHGDVGIIDLSGIKWVVIGAETGIRSGKIIPKKDWVMNIVEQADRRNIPVFMKDSLFSIVGEENFRQDDFPWL